MKQKAKTKKTVFISFLIVLVILIVSVVGISVAGILKGANTDDGIVAFAKDTVNLVILRKDIREYVSYDDLMADLKKNGFGDILFPKEISSNLDKYKMSAPKYYDIGVEQVSFDIIFNEIPCGFTITKEELAQLEMEFVDLNNARTITVKGIDVYIFEYNNSTSAKLCYNGLCYDISMESSYDELLKIVESIE